jgi:GT2 family glycosyltransferase
MRIDLVILNYNGRQLLAECLPSVLRAAECSRHHCRVVVIDNDSTDDSVAWLAENFAEVPLIRRPNEGLCSFNPVVASLDCPVAILLNNDIKLDARCVDLLIAPLLESSSCFMSAPLCWRFDGKTYEGFKTAVRWRWGLVQATALFPGHKAGIHRTGLTASTGAVMAVDVGRFVELGGFDPLYLPGRLEDLDFALRGYQAGYHARYVPEAVAWHLGMATFAPVFGESGCERLALRNTLLLQWKNLRHPLHVARQLIGLPVRLALDLFRAAWVPRQRRWMFTRALLGALARTRQLRSASYSGGGSIARERKFFRRFHPRQMTGGSHGRLSCESRSAASGEKRLLQPISSS